ncbi:hypothetical protein FF011L_35760 [Roseimaritima multifibrata]|uniref:DUF7133 domain-containing protein n=1 Tax=Roseimaritima multifibrata TaxID=1930274 RepID=A0A517MIW3_9BACT|nr:hypothetical protein [Roseimaritima multifibrata]QDS94794.1 hypothetical protein FF011L_35760 [Roseimaritima multifibrata]
MILFHRIPSLRIARSPSWSFSKSAACLFCLLASAGIWSEPLRAAEPKEEDFYEITSFEIPDGVVLEACGFQLMPDGRLAIASRRGEIWMVTDPFAKSVPAANFKRFAQGLHEPLSLDYEDGWLYVTQRPELSRIKDEDGDGSADVFETVNDEWGISGDYHEYAFGSKADKNGDRWIVLCLTGSFSSKVPYRGWCVRITPDGKLVPTTSGIRSPGGIRQNAAGDMFYTDNQGPWNGVCGLKHLIPGKFAGHPGGFEWYKLATESMGPQPPKPKSDSRIMTEAARIEEFEPPAVLFPYPAMGQSASGIVCDTTDGKFGPFENQMFVADQSHSTVMRVYLEKVQGHYQGACFPFRAGFGSGNVGLEMSPDGSMFVGGTNRGWGARGPKPFAVERMNWTGKTPFEILEMRAIEGGFELVLTEPAKADSLKGTDNFAMKTYTYIYREQYGSPAVDETVPKITDVQLSADGLHVVLKIDGLQIGHVHELTVTGLLNKAGNPLLHPKAYYTLNYLP